MQQILTDNAMYFLLYLYYFVTDYVYKIKLIVTNNHDIFISTTSYTFIYLYNLNLIKKCRYN